MWHLPVPCVCFGCLHVQQVLLQHNVQHSWRRGSQRRRVELVLWCSGSVFGLFLIGLWQSVYQQLFADRLPGDTVSGSIAVVSPSQSKSCSTKQCGAQWGLQGRACSGLTPAGCAQHSLCNKTELWVRRQELLRWEGDGEVLGRKQERVQFIDSQRCALFIPVVNPLPLPAACTDGRQIRGC